MVKALSQKTLPALSIRQPWATAIFILGKRFENRSRRFHYRGPLIVHASGFYAARSFDADIAWIERCMGIKRSRLEALRHAPRGGLLGLVTVVDCIDHSASPWFTGPHALLLSDPLEVEFCPWRGRQGIFPVPRQALKFAQGSRFDLRASSPKVGGTKGL